MRRSEAGCEAGAGVRRTLERRGHRSMHDAISLRGGEERQSLDRVDTGQTSTRPQPHVRRWFEVVT